MNDMALLRNSSISVLSRLLANKVCGLVDFSIALTFGKTKYILDQFVGCVCRLILMNWRRGSRNWKRCMPKEEKSKR